MHTQFRCQRNTADKEEKGIQRIGYHHEKGRYAESFVDRARNEIHEREHAEDCDKHAVIDDGWTAADGFMDHVTDKRQD